MDDELVGRDGTITKPLAGSVVERVGLRILKCSN